MWLWFRRRKDHTHIPSVRVVLEHDTLRHAFLKQYRHHSRVRFLEVVGHTALKTLYDDYVKERSRFSIGASRKVQKRMIDALTSYDAINLKDVIDDLQKVCIQTIDRLRLVENFMTENNEAHALLSQPDVMLLDRLARPEYLDDICDLLGLTEVQLERIQFTVDLHAARHRPELITSLVMQHEEVISSLPMVIQRGVYRGSVPFVIEARLVMLEALVGMPQLMALAQDIV